MKPFNLELALAGHPVCTRDGRKVLQLFYFDKANINDQKLCAYIDNDSSTKWFDEDGSWISLNTPSEYDLFMAPKTKKLWIAITKVISSTRGAIPHHMTSEAYLNDEEVKCLSADKYWIKEIEVEE